jgi:hypothetical protein
MFHSKFTHELSSRHDPAHLKTLRNLRELIAALDRRVPQVARVGEVGIARSGTELRAAALRRIDELERAGQRRSSR